MPLPRKILTVAVLALYIALAVGGRGVHLWEHSTGNVSCCESAHLGSISDSSHFHDHSPTHDHQDGQCCHPSQDDNGQQQNDNHPDGEKNSHDSSTCWLCQVIGQAQDRTLESQTDLVMAVASAAPVQAPEFYPLSIRFGIQSRAPPSYPA